MFLLLESLYPLSFQQGVRESLKDVQFFFIFSTICYHFRKGAGDRAYKKDKNV